MKLTFEMSITINMKHPLLSRGFYSDKSRMKTVNYFIHYLFTYIYLPRGNATNIFCYSQASLTFLTLDLSELN